MGRHEKVGNQMKPGAAAPAIEAPRLGGQISARLVARVEYDPQFRHRPMERIGRGKVGAYLRPDHIAGHERACTDSFLERGFGGRPAAGSPRKTSSKTELSTAVRTRLIHLRIPRLPAGLLQASIDVEPRENAVHGIHRALRRQGLANHDRAAMELEIQYLPVSQAEAVPQRLRDGDLTFLGKNRFYTLIIGIPTKLIQNPGIGAVRRGAFYCGP